MPDPDLAAYDRRWPWLAAAGLLLISAVLLARAVWLHWLPCRGSMTNGLLAFDGGREFSDACLERMDAGLPYVFPTELAERTPGAFGYGAAAMTVAALVWLVPAVGLRLRVRQRLLLTIPAVLQLGTVLVAAIESTDRSWGPDQYSSWEWLDLLSLPVACAVVIAVTGTGTRYLLALLVVAGGATVGSTFHQIAQYGLMVTVSQANWDNPPGTGYPAVATLVAAASVLLLLQVRRPAAPTPVAAADPVPVSGRA